MLFDLILSLLEICFSLQRAAKVFYFFLSGKPLSAEHTKGEQHRIAAREANSFESVHSLVQGELFSQCCTHTLKVLPFQSVISNSWMHQKAFRRLKGNMGPLLENREGIHFVKYCTPVSRYCIACLCVFVRGQFMKIWQNNKGILTLKSVNHSNSHTATQANQFHVN